MRGTKRTAKVTQRGYRAQKTTPIRHPQNFHDCVIGASRRRGKTRIPTSKGGGEEVNGGKQGGRKNEVERIKAQRFTANCLLGGVKKGLRSAQK